MPQLHLLPFAVADGPTNMAADETLLEMVADGAAVLRLYGWSTPTVSLGYFQESAERRKDPLLADLPYVRRPSGGEALVHHHEVTYALALPAGLPWQPRGESWTRRLHEVLRAALATLGVSCELCPPDGEQRLGAFLCFLHHTPDDLLIGSAKIVGSAQRRPHGALLQHGGILLAGSPHTPQLPGIAERTGRRLNPLDVQTAVVAELTRTLGWEIVPGEWSARQRARVDELIRTRYGAAEWNDKR